MVIVKRTMCQPGAVTVSDFVQYGVLILNSKQMFAAARIIGCMTCVCVCLCMRVCVCKVHSETLVEVRNYRDVCIPYNIGISFS